VLANINPQRDMELIAGPAGTLDHAPRMPWRGSKARIDATRKWPTEGFTRPWPDEIVIARGSRRGSTPFRAFSASILEDASDEPGFPVRWASSSRASLARRPPQRGARGRPPLSWQPLLQDSHERHHWLVAPPPSSAALARADAIQRLVDELPSGGIDDHLRLAAVDMRAIEELHVTRDRH
jgi:hypothetical protein